MDDLEQQCEDAVFNVCDARERYPLHCAEELAKCIELTNEIQMTRVVTKPVKILNMSVTNEHLETLQKNFSDVTELLKTQEQKLQVMTNKVNNLTAVLEQIKNDKLCEANKLLWQ
ncbi:hypothetical protein PUN28_007193 [Cardiocondyla obscurior]|uniref:Uncharacterized protein n=1 Tax=Cardiocondyla obscurior TaxID=286306 RepID=A0AAW2G3W7_9HYME